MWCLELLWARGCDLTGKCETQTVTHSQGCLKLLLSGGQQGKLDIMGFVMWWEALHAIHIFWKYFNRCQMWHKAFVFYSSICTASRHQYAVCFSKYTVGTQLFFACCKKHATLERHRGKAFSRLLVKYPQIAVNDDKLVQPVPSMTGCFCWTPCALDCFFICHLNKESNLILSRVAMLPSEWVVMKCLLQGRRIYYHVGGEMHVQFIWSANQLSFISRFVLVSGFGFLCSLRNEGLIHQGFTNVSSNWSQHESL